MIGARPNPAPSPFHRTIAALVLAGMIGGACFARLSESASAESPWATEPIAQAPADAWPQLEAALSRRPDDQPGGVRGRFEQRRESMLLTEPMLSHGNFAVVDGHARFDTVAPQPSVMLVAPDAVTMHDPTSGQTERYDRQGQADLLGLMLTGDVTALREQFAATALPTDSPDNLAFKLTPLEPDDESPAAVRLEVGTQRGEPRRVRVEQADGDTFDLRFLDLQRDATLTPDQLRTGLSVTEDPNR